MTELRELTMEQMESVYKEHMTKDFPKDELRPLWKIRESFLNGIQFGYGLYEISEDCFDMDGREGKLLAYALLLRQQSEEGSAVLLDYFAVTEENRGQGTGTFFLGKIRQMLKNNLFMILEVEHPDAAEDESERRRRERQIDFYRRNGARKTSQVTKVNHVTYLILTIAIKQNPDALLLREKISSFYKVVLPPEWHDKGLVEIEENTLAKF